MVIGQAMFLPAAWSWLSLKGRLSVLITCFFPYLTTYLCASSDPGIITAANHASNMRLYPYDHLLFYPGVKCRTCGFEKPARSKHCRLCKSCIAKNDHHCAWINNCVGYENHHYFLLLLLSTSLLVTYGAYLGYQLISDLLHQMYLPFLWEVFPTSSRPTRSDMRWSSNLTWTDYLSIWTWVIADQKRISSVGLLCLLCAPLAWGFLGYHIYLVWAGTTTNETGKWSIWRDDVADGLVYKRIRPAHFLDPQNSSDSRQLKENSIPWPRTTTQRLIRTSSPAPAADSQYRGENNWQAISSMAQVDNMYDLGFAGNLRDIFFARSKD